MQRQLSAVHPRSGKAAYAIYQMGSHSVWVALPPDDVYWRNGGPTKTSPAQAPEGCAEATAVQPDHPPAAAAAASPIHEADALASDGAEDQAARAPPAADGGLHSPAPEAPEDGTPGPNADWRRHDRGDEASD